MPKAVVKRDEKTIDRLIQSAAGAIFMSDGIEHVLALPDDILGAMLKKKIKWLRRRLKLDKPAPKRSKSG
jgi:hypothetical protein